MSGDLPRPRPHVAALPLYEPGASRGRGGRPPIKLSSNESALGPSPRAVEAYRAAATSLHRYPEAGDADLRAALADVHRLEPDRIVLSNGSDHIIYLLLAAFAGAGDEVVVSEHGFFRNTLSVHACGATPVVAPERDYTTSVDAILAVVTARTRVVMLANPNNPTGTYVPSGELSRLVRGLSPHVLLIVDSAYAEYVTEADYCDGLDLARAAAQVVTTRTFSKAYGLAGLRIGWAYGSPVVVDAFERARLPYPVSGPAGAAAVAALADEDHLASVVAYNARARARMATGLAGLGLDVLPSVANFNTCSVHSSRSARRPGAGGPPEPAGVPASGAWQAAVEAVGFLADRDILVRPLGPAGLPEFVRITVGLEEENEALLEGVRAFVEDRD